MTLKPLMSVEGDFSQRVFSSTGMSLNDFYRAIKSKDVSKIVQVSIHNSCQQACSHCFQLETKPRKVDNITKRLETILRKNSSPNIRKFPFAREPLLLPELFPIYKDVGCTEISSTTLSLSRNSNLIEELKKNNITTIFVSLHGDKEQHSKLTNSDPTKYDEIISNVKRLVSSGFTVEIITTLYRHNIESLDFLPETLIDCGVSKWWVQRIMPTGRATYWKASDFIYGDECNQIMAKFADLRLKYGSKELHIGLDLTWGPNFYSKKMLRYLSGQENRWPWSRYVCPAVSGDSATISLESGNVYPCLFFETFPDTQIGHQEDLVLKHQFSEVSLQENLQGQCKDCFYKPFCLGGCRAVAYSFAKFFGTKNPLFAGQDYCLTRQLDKELDDSDV